MIRVGILVLALSVSSIPAYAATYYVGTSGSDTTGDGSSGNRWRNPQKCVGIVGPGDTCIVGNGTYTDTDGDGLVLYISSARSAIAGTSGNPITIKAENLHGAKLVLPNGATSSAYGVRLTVPYYVIEGFEITDNGAYTAQGASTGYHGISLGESGGATGAVIRRNHIHDIARGVCSDSTIGNYGIGGRPGVGTTIEYNSIHTIGRLLNGESGCVTVRYQNDHGIYVWYPDTFTVHHNLFYDNARGFAFTVYSPGQISNGVIFANNTVSQPTLSGALKPGGCLNLSYTNTNAQIKNNIFNNCPLGYALFWFAAATQTNVVLSYNLTDSADPDLQNPSGQPASGVTVNNNTVGSSSINFTSPVSNNYTLLSTSAAIDTGTDIGYPYNGSVPTKGAFDPPRFSACEVPSGSGNTVQVSFTNNLYPPMLPASGGTGITVRRDTVANTVTGTGKAGDNVIALTVNTAYGIGNTVDISHTSGTYTDSALIGGTVNQPFVSALTNQTCSNHFSGIAYTVTQSRYEWQGAIGTEAAPLVLPHGYASSGAAENFVNYTTVAGGKIRLRLELVCGGANCDPLGFALFYALNGGAYTNIPDTFGAGNIAMCGALPGVPTNGAATTAQLSGSGTFRTGGILSSSSSIPLISGMNNGDKTEMAYCVKFDTDASGYYEFRVYKADGSAIDAYTVTPKLTIIPYAMGF